MSRDCNIITIDKKNKSYM